MEPVKSKGLPDNVNFFLPEFRFPQIRVGRDSRVPAAKLVIKNHFPAVIRYIFQGLQIVMAGPRSAMKNQQGIFSRVTASCTAIPGTVALKGNPPLGNNIVFSHLKTSVI
jgi:hypothetical protein